jgi:FF domain
VFSRGILRLIPHALYFQTLLREKDINPLHPWDTSLPLFISDPRYVLLPSVAARREAFDEYCRERARELRASRVKKGKEDPKEEFDQLLTVEVKSTRTSWTDFRRQWKKDRRFYGWGRDDREREKRFREFLKELGESMCFACWCTALHDLNHLRKANTRPEGGGGLLRTSQRKRHCSRRCRLERGM